MDWVWGERRLVQLAASASGTVLTDPLPDGAELRDLCGRAGFELVWDGATFRSPQSMTATGKVAGGRSDSSSLSLAVEGSAAADVPARLTEAVRRGGVRFITVRPKRAARVRHEVAQIVAKPVDVSAMFVRILRTQAAAARIPDFGVVLRADAAEPGSRDQLNLGRLLDRTFEAMAEELAGNRVLALDGLTPLGRYPAGQQLVNRLIDNARYGGSAAGPDTLILICPAGDERQHPHVGRYTLWKGAPEEWVLATPSWLDKHNGAA